MGPTFIEVKFGETKNKDKAIYFDWLDSSKTAAFKRVILLLFYSFFILKIDRSWNE